MKLAFINETKKYFSVIFLIIVCINATERCALVMEKVDDLQYANVNLLV